MNADKWKHPARFTGNWPNWNGYTWLDWTSYNCYHPGEDLNFGHGDQDCGQRVESCANGVVFHTSKKTTGYGNLIITKHTLGYNLKRFIKETYGIETDTLYSLYAHLKDILVSVGNKVDIGSLIAHVGKTGTKSCHLHFEIYHLQKDLKNVSYRYYPVGKSKQFCKDNWLPAYQFIEATKNLESYGQFMGKPKEYWIELEKNKETVDDRLEKQGDEFLKIKDGLEKDLVESQKRKKQLEIESANFDKKFEKAEDTHQKKVEKLEDEVDKQKERISYYKNRQAEILAEVAEKYTLREWLILFIKKIGG